MMVYWVFGPQLLLKLHLSHDSCGALSKRAHENDPLIEINLAGATDVGILTDRPTSSIQECTRHPKP